MTISGRLCCRTMARLNPTVGTGEEATGKNGQVCCIVFLFCVAFYFVLYFTVGVVSCDSSYFVLY